MTSVDQNPLMETIGIGPRRNFIPDVSDWWCPRDFSTRNDQFAWAMESPTVPNIGDRVDPSCSLVPDPALEAIRLSSIDLCVGLFIIEGRQQRHATFEALHGHHDVETFLDVLRTPRVFLLYSATSAKPFRGKNFVRTS